MPAVFIICIACNSNSNSEKEFADSSDTKKSEQRSMIDPDPTDTIPADGYAVYNSNLEIAAIIRKSIQSDMDTILKNAPDLIPTDERRFKYHAIDLNGDGINELFVAPMPFNFFCGSGGCTAYLMDASGKTITKFSVTDFPIMVANAKTGEWPDLVIYSGRKNRLVKWKSNSYPFNPSVEPEYKGDVPGTMPLVLNIFKEGYPAFTY